MPDREPQTSPTLGGAIDQLVRTLEQLDGASQLTALQAACAHLKIPFGTPLGAPSRAHGAPTPPTGQEPPEQGLLPQDIRSLKERKEPGSANEMAALVAFYLAELAPHAHRKSEVDVQDMLRYFKQAGFRLPKTPRQLLHNAAQAGYFDSLGEGRFRLNPVGYNLVAFQMPRAGTRATDQKHRRKRNTSRPRTKRKRSR